MGRKTTREIWPQQTIGEDVTMATVYVVTSGEHEGCRTYGVFDTYEKAEYAQDLFMADDIEEFELNYIQDHPTGMFMFDVTMDTMGNRIKNYDKIDRVSPVDSSDEEMKSGFWKPTRTTTGVDVISFYIWARDEGHAVEVANERRIQLLNSGELTHGKR